MRKKLTFINVSLLFLSLLVALLFFSRMLGFTAYVVESSSMEPSLSIGTIVFSKPVAFSSLEKGQVITFQRGDSYVTHRITRINREEKSVSTKGDAGIFGDLYTVSRAAVKGRVFFHLPYIGYLSLYAQSKFGKYMFALMFALLALAILYDKSSKIGKEEVI